MKTEDILSIEESGENRINLVRDRLFWQAWNRSAFLFVSHIRKYQVHKRFVQKVSQEVAWLGFPKTAMDTIEKVARDKGWTFERVSADHIVIGGVPQTNGYEKWWAGIVKPPKAITAAAGPKEKSGAPHFLYNRIYPVFDRKFIYDSYSCRVGKGTLFGINRARRFLRSCGAAGAGVWVLRLDIQGYFMAINREILFKLIMDGLGKYGFDDSEDAGLTGFLIRKTVFNDPLKNARFRSPPGAWGDLPKDKSLMNSAPNCGLPIGNLTSQLFANIYLNPLDHFVKRELKIKYYGRYVDDMLLVHRDKAALLGAVSRIREFLSKTLRLTLHPRKIKLQPAEKGFAFLGMYIYPNRVAAGRRIARNFKSCVFNPDPDYGRQGVRVQSYLGLLSHFGG